jgi:tyrosine-protein phosphatase YwqE
MSDFYRNSSETILNKLTALHQYLYEKKITIEIKAAAEYYLDEALFEKLESNTPLLTFGEKFLLFETNFMTEPLNMKEFIFTASTKGYRPVLAHPERYLYLQSDFKKVEELLDRGVLFQLNIASISGHYSKAAQRLAHKLIDNKWVQLLGSDCHNMQHIAVLEETIRHKYFQKAISLPLLNNSL